MTCNESHGFAVLDGRCSDCGQVLTWSGRLNVETGTGPGWRAPPFATDTDARCRTGAGHQPDTASGVCAVCCMQLDAFRDPTGEGDRLRWFETTY